MSEKKFCVRLTCCGQDNGYFGPATWDECDAFRESYLSGPGVDDGGHDRSAIIIAERTP